jgi:hypothetical protein
MLRVSHSERARPLGLAYILVWILGGFTYPCAADQELESLDSLRWEHRVILVFAGKADAAHAASNLQEFSSGIVERDIVWFVLDGEMIRTNYEGELDAGFSERLAQAYFRPAPTETAVVLIGKDGFVKSRSDDLDLESTFATIDRMPMRRREMRRQDEGAR